MENHPKFNIFYSCILRILFYFQKKIIAQNYQKLYCLCSWIGLNLLCLTTSFAQVLNYSNSLESKGSEALSDKNQASTKQNKIGDEQILETVNITYDRAAKNSISDETGGSV